ncbi:MAG: hypothetical protein ABEI97_03700 [Candidatus Nanohaloarchaea archaeon]
MNRLVPVAVAALLILPAAAAVDVGSGVQFNLSEHNASLESGKTYSFDTITVHDDAVTFDGNNVSVIHAGSGYINATLWNYTVQEIVSEPSIRISTNTSDETEVTFNFTGMVQERTYRIDKDGSRIVTPETGQEAVLTWNESDWTGPANFTATLLETLKNATVILKGSFNHPQDTVTIDGTDSPSTGVFTPGEVDFGYAAFDLAGDIAGIVPAGTFQELEFTNTSSRYVFAQTQEIGDSIFLLPLTEGDSGVIEDRESAIQGSLFGGSNFLSFPDPSFAYELSEKKTVRVALSYDAISLDGFEETISPGTYTVTITNEGVEDGKTQVNVTVQ